ncbi:MAG: hypothetical protein K2L61_00950, partial [Clostridia bacterium]|nr:hypothetical protein [Clostridia bacterium]
CLVLALTIVIGVPVTTVSLIPKPIEGEVTKLSHIDFSSQKEYTLKCDIVIPQDYVVDKFNCTLIGGGYKLIFGKGATLGELNGKLSDLTIESRGDTIFKSVSQSAVINNVTVNVNADIATTEAKAFVALSNYGVIENVTVNVSGKLSALAASSQVTEELTFGGIVLNNIYNKYDSSTQTFFDGIIRNCVVNYSQFSLVGEASANAVFGGIAGFNNGCLQGCKVTGEIIADTFDVVGICVVNNVLLSDNANQADISQTSADTGWNPIVSGIVLRNNNTLENCQNTGKISAVSDSDQTDAQDDNKLTVSAAGIAYLNNGALEKCKNSAPITAVGKGDAYVGGIAAHSYSGIYNCLSSGDITVKAQTLYVGGIIGSSEVVSNGFYVYFGRVESCISNCKIDAVAIGDKPSYVGGIAGYVREEGFNVGNSTQYFGGCVINSYFVGELATEVSYFGNIVGVCGATVYEKNSYTSTSGVEYYNFDGNYYLDNSLKAFGATVIDDDNFAQVEDKGAMSATMEYIQNSEIYKSILKIFN